MIRLLSSNSDIYVLEIFVPKFSKYLQKYFILRNTQYPCKQCDRDVTLRLLEEVLFICICNLTYMFSVFWQRIDDGSKN